MRRRNRDISIFSLSMLDVISGALGAFLLLVGILMPYYRNNADVVEENRRLQQAANELRNELDQAHRNREQARTELDQAMAELERTRAERDQARNDRDTAQAQARELGEQLAKTILVVLIKWTTVGQDVDLHVVDPSGVEFFYNNKKVAGHPGELTEDDTRGPGHEIWSIQAAPPGEYKIYFRLYNRRNNSQNPTVTGRVFHRDGSRELPAITLTELKRKELAMTVVVAPDGGVSFR